MACVTWSLMEMVTLGDNTFNPWRVATSDNYFGSVGQLLVPVPHFENRLLWRG